MNFFWGDSQGKRGEDADADVKTNSTFDLLSLPTSDAGTFYETLNKEIDGLRAKVDSQLRDMVEASRRDITLLETKLREIQSGESTISSNMKYDSSSQLYSNDSNITEPVTNLSSTAKSRTTDGNLNPSEEARLIGIVKIGPVTEGREDDENDESEESCQTHPQDQILQSRISPDQTANQNSISVWNPCSRDGLALVDNQDPCNNTPTVKTKESKVDAIDNARRARRTPISHSLNTSKDYDNGPRDLTGSIEEAEKLNTIRNQRSLIDAESDDCMSEYAKANENTNDSSVSREKDSPVVPPSLDCLEDAVLRKRQSDDPKNMEQNAETTRLEDSLADTVDDYSSKHTIAQVLTKNTSNPAVATKSDQKLRQAAPLSPEKLRGLKLFRRGTVDPPIDKKKVPSNPFYAMRIQPNDNDHERASMIENVRSQSLTPTAMTKSPDGHHELSSPQSIRPDSAPPVASSISLARMNYGSVSEDSTEHVAEDSETEKPLGAGRQMMKNVVKRFLSPSKTKSSQALIEQESRLEEQKCGRCQTESDRQVSGSSKSSKVFGKELELHDEDHYYRHKQEHRNHAVRVIAPCDFRAEDDDRKHNRENISKVKKHVDQQSEFRSRDAIDDYYERSHSVSSNQSFQDHDTRCDEENLDQGLLYSVQYNDDNKEQKSNLSESEKDSGREWNEKSFGDLFVRHHEDLTGEKKALLEDALELDKRSNRRTKAPIKSREKSHDHDMIGGSLGSHEFQICKPGSYNENETDFVQRPTISNDDDCNAEVSSALVKWSPPEYIRETSSKVQMKKIKRRQPSPEKLMRTRNIIVENYPQVDHKGGRTFFQSSLQGGTDVEKSNKEKRRKKIKKKIPAETEQPSSFSRAIVPHINDKVVAVPRAKYTNHTVTNETDRIAVKKTIQNGQMVILSEVQGKMIKDPYGDEGRYTGITLDGLPHGEGIMHYSDGRSYTGEWLYGRWHGKGRALFVNGDLYVGKYDRDRRHGRGRYEWSDGRIYDGDFVHNQRHGHGSYTWPDGASYVGEFVDGQRHGEGCYRFADGSVYEGEWKNGKYDGVGECVWASGRKYHGEWRAGQAEGFGVEFRSDGTIRHEGEWKKDRPVRRRKDPQGAKPSAEAHRRR